MILLTALNQEEQIVQGFQAGADDYVTKPFSPRQLAMRIRAIWRRAPNWRAGADARVARRPLVLDAESHDVRLDDRPIQLTPIEFRLLYILAANNGRVVSTSRLVDYAWGYDGGDISLLKTHVSHIRKKLQLPQDEIGEIRAIPRVGYRLTQIGGVVGGRDRVASGVGDPGRWRELGRPGAVDSPRPRRTAGSRPVTPRLKQAPRR